jgi:hypothetical protein
MMNRRGSVWLLSVFVCSILCINKINDCHLVLECEKVLFVGFHIVLVGVVRESVWLSWLGRIS